MSVFLEGIIGASAVALVSGIIAIVRLLVKVIDRVDSLTPSMQAVYQAMPPMIRAMRLHNAALREAGANGSTLKADACLDEADAALDRRLVDRVGGAA